MFHDAVVEELIDTNPCVLKRGDLPKKIDKDPTWRPGAVFSREEVERLISSDALPEDRRTLYAVLMLAGLRFGEAAALRWSNYDAAAKPLGRLLLASSYNIKKKSVKAVKTRAPTRSASASDPRQDPRGVDARRLGTHDGPKARGERSADPVTLGRPPQRQPLAQALLRGLRSNRAPAPPSARFAAQLHHAGANGRRAP